MHMEATFGAHSMCSIYMMWRTLHYFLNHDLLVPKSISPKILTKLRNRCSANHKQNQLIK